MFCLFSTIRSPNSARLVTCDAEGPVVETLPFPHPAVAISDDQANQVGADCAQAAAIVEIVTGGAGVHLDCP